LDAGPSEAALAWATGAAVAGCGAACCGAAALRGDAGNKAIDAISGNNAIRASRPR
jgi:hypothetical protein